MPNYLKATIRVPRFNPPDNAIVYIPEELLDSPYNIHDIAKARFQIISATYPSTFYQQNLKSKFYFLIF